MHSKRTGVKLEQVVLMVIILLSVANMVWQGFQKEGYHIDEMYSYGYSNSEYLPIPHFGTHDYTVKDWMKVYGAGESVFDLIKNLGKDFEILKQAGFNLHETEIYQNYLKAKKNSYDMTTTTWVSGRYYEDFLEVTRESRFNFASVYYNTRGDAHPPLYYFMLHSVSSFFPESFSKWFGIGLNIFLMIFLLRVLYFVVYELTNDAFPSLLAVAVYAFSRGAVSTVLFLRMYTLLTLSFLLMLYVHFKIVDDGFEIKGKHTKKLIAVTVLGYLSQYYFVFYAFFLALVMTILFIKRKKWKALMSYYIRLFWSAVIGVCLWPYSIKQAFFSSRGSDTITAFEGFIDPVRVRTMFWHLTEFIFGGSSLLIWVLLILTVINLAVFKKMPEIREKAVLTCIPVFGSFFIISKVAVFLADRYIMCLYPFVCLYLIVSVYFGTKLIPLKKDDSTYKKSVERKYLKPQIMLTVLAAVVFLAFGNSFSGKPEYLFTGGQETIKLPDDTDSIFVLIDGTYNESVQYASVLAQSKRVGISFYSELQALRDGYEEDKGKYLCVFMQDYMDEDDVIEKVKEGLGTDALTEVERAQSHYVKRVLFRTE